MRSAEKSASTTSARDAFLQEVSSHIRWKQARPYATKELADHIADQTSTLVAEGHAHNEAEALAVKEMGNPAEIGLALDDAYRKKTSWGMLLPLLLLACLAQGLPLIAGLPNTHLPLALTLGIGGFLIAYHLNLSWLIRQAWVIYGFFCAAMLVIPAAGISRFVNGAALETPFLALFIPFVYGLVTHKMRGKGLWGLLFCGALYMPLALLVFIAPSHSSLILVTVICLGILCVEIIKGWFGENKIAAFCLVFIPVVLALVLLLFALPLPYAVQRASAASSSASSFIDAAVAGLQQGDLSQIEYRLFGQAYSLIFLRHSFGWPHVVLVVGSFLLLCAIGYYNASRQSGQMVRLLAYAIITTFLLQGLLYVAINLGLYGLPTSYPFPLMGNSGFVCNMALLGLLFSVCRTGRLYSEILPEKTSFQRKIIEWNNGTLTLRLRRG